MRKATAAIVVHEPAESGVFASGIMLLKDFCLLEMETDWGFRQATAVYLPGLQIRQGQDTAKGARSWTHKFWSIA
ncbi:MAG: hypothetical protein M3O22_09215 [Pseudomonadota bacterium]|nr:hypothetical protein [Pseudomonadota bacterium]